MSTIETATDYGLKEYLPLSKGERRGKALALSAECFPEAVLGALF